MEYQQGQDREQLSLYSTCLDDMIPEDNSVRLIDQFVNLIDLSQMGFQTIGTQGRPPYDPADLLKLFIYGYMNQMRSSRRLEKEAYRNIEVIWLIKNLKPDHNTIARFRKENPKAIRKVFRQSVAIARNFNLIGGTLIAGDSTKLRAQNSKKNNYNKKKIQRHLEYIDRKLEEHNQELAKADGDQKKTEEIKEQIKGRKQQQTKYRAIQKQLDKDASSENPQRSTSDPDSRHQIVRGTVTEVCYTAQTTVDAKHKLLIDYKLTNQNDKKAMGFMLRRAKSILRSNSFTALYDKGYHTGSEFHIADSLGIDTLVAIPAIGRKSQAPDPKYNAKNFIYNPDDDAYTCPQGNTLYSNGSWYKARNYTFKQYKTKACKECPVRSKCTTAKANGKIIQRTQFTQNIQGNAKRVEQSGELYKERQALVEHPYGTMKRQWGFDHIMTKRGIKAAAADFGLIALAYNLRRLFNSKIALQQLIVALFLTFKKCIKASIRRNKAFTECKTKNTDQSINFVFNTNFNYF
ncbi:IS1182 family transposase [Zunongwangia sp. HGR-M22]|uniref:IS1182 family transposase n=1 Tax=Zunongwangia sp. HGR-M22 TaxID=3015168 RepID=UPI0022DE69EE|nr:IS1182 family transposase [Zunongwangia sp. HGR-M22]WBL24256.1 IS1182 family transposase [Zunongwangia sp. HGR-M22]WBL26757.1 IS1182 family transposase [Zunongwangia sp. HGR-M22]